MRPAFPHYFAAPEDQHTGLHVIQFLVRKLLLILLQFEMSKKSILDPVSKFAFSGHGTREEG